VRISDRRVSEPVQLVTRDVTEGINYGETEFPSCSTYLITLLTWQGG